MASIESFNPTGRFSGLANTYARHRPDYPATALDWIVNHCRLGPQSLLIDVGCGTGTSSRQIALRGIPVLGIEPNADMRAQAEKADVPAGLSKLAYRDGRAEATGLDVHVADAVLAAQAFHWFDPNMALCEFYRILKHGGWAALVWNERDESDPFTAAYGVIVGGSAEAKRVEGPRGQAGEPLLVSPLFHQGERAFFSHEQRLDEAGMIGRALSVSYAPKDPIQVEAHISDLRKVFAQFQQSGQIVLRYRTEVIIAQKQPGS